MDLIYTDSDKKELGVIKNFYLDLAYGTDENDFELTCNSCELKDGQYVFIEGTEYGGRIDGIKIDMAKNKIVYTGKTWQGILDTKVIKPDTGAYYTISGDSNTVLNNLIEKLDLTDLFEADTATSDVGMPVYSFNRYTTAYKGLIHMCNTFGLKLICSFVGGKVKLKLQTITDYTETEQFDKAMIDFRINKNKPYNHMVVLGKGELENRLVIDLYLGEDGVISDNQFYFGIDEAVYVYENTSYESIEELDKQAREKFFELINREKVEVSFNSTDKTYDIGDIVGAKEYVTGVEVKRKIAKKIINMTDDYMKVSYKVGGK